MDFTKLQRVNYAFFQTDVNGNLWGTDSWGDPNVLFGPYDWNPGPSSKQFCSWDSPTDRPWLVVTSHLFREDTSSPIKLTTSYCFC